MRHEKKIKNNFHQLPLQIEEIPRDSIQITKYNLPIRTTATSEASAQYCGFVICLIKNLSIGSNERSCRFDNAIGRPSRCINSVNKAKVIPGVIP